MTHVSPSNNVISQVDAMEKMNKTGDGGNSDNSCFYVYDLEIDIRVMES